MMYERIRYWVRPAVLTLVAVAGVLAVTLSSMALLVAMVPLVLAWPFASVVDAYGDLVARAVERVFGRLDVGWMHVTELEGHVMVLAGTVLVIIARDAFGIRATGMRRRAGYRMIALLVVSCFACIVVLPLVVLPGWWGTGMVAANLAVLAVATFRIADR